MYRCNWNFKLCIITCDFATFYLKFAQSQRRKGGNVSVCFSYTLIEGLLELQAIVCARRAGVTGCLGERPIRPFSLLGPKLSFCALCTGVLSISLQRAFC